MTDEVDGRLVIHCDRCPVRLDLGPAQVAMARNRRPSGWLEIGPDKHLCPMCAMAVPSPFAIAS
jgi:hypothetical protein